MGKRTRINIIVSVGTALIIIGILSGQYHAKSHFKKLTLEWNNRSAQVIARKAKIIDKSGVPLKEISYVDLKLLVNSFNANRVWLTELQKRMASGEGMKPWFTSRWASTSTFMQEWIDAEALFIGQAQSAIVSISDLQQRSSATIAMSSTIRLKAVRILNPDSDSEDFQKQVSESLESLRTFPPLAKALYMSQGTSHLSGITELLRTAMLRKMALEINEEESLQQIRLAAIRAAENALINYKNEVERIAQERMGTILAAGNIANFVQPAIENAFQATRPVRNLLDEAHRPVMGGESSLDLASRLDPNVRITVNIIDGLCGGIESARREVADLIKVSSPLLESLSEFRSTRSRVSIKNIVSASYSAASYYKRRIDIFDSLILNINEAQQQIRELFGTISRLQLPIVEVVISRLAETADFLVKSAKAPLEQARHEIGNVALSLSAFSSLEQTYITSLRSLSADSPDALAVDTPRLDETQHESMDNTSHAEYQESPRLKQSVPSVVLRSIPMCEGEKKEGWQESLNCLR